MTCSGWIVVRQWLLSNQWRNFIYYLLQPQHCGWFKVFVLCGEISYCISYCFFLNLYFYSSVTEKTIKHILKKCHVQKCLCYFVVFRILEAYAWIVEWVIMVCYICLERIVKNSSVLSFFLNDSLELTSFSIACMSQQYVFPVLKSCQFLASIYTIYRTS